MVKASYSSSVNKSDTMSLKYLDKLFVLQKRGVRVRPARRKFE